jgi:hypothetical protein
MSNVKNQGEGDRESARRYNEKTQKFVQSKKGKESTRKVDHSGRHSSDELQKAEDDAVARVKENDPRALRDYSKPAR